MVAETGSVVRSPIPKDKGKNLRLVTVKGGKARKPAPPTMPPKAAAHPPKKPKPKPKPKRSPTAKHNTPEAVLKVAIAQERAVVKALERWETAKVLAKAAKVVHQTAVAKLYGVLSEADQGTLFDNVR